jgi:hypothetical protein
MKLLAAFVLGLASVTAGAVAAETPKHIAEAYLSVTGKPETVFDWSKDRCDREDIPDLAARAFRDADGKVQLIDTHQIWRRSTGPNLNDQTHLCKVVFRSAFSGDPAVLNDRHWAASLYTEDGKTIYVLQHEEFWGQTHKGKCPSRDPVKCWASVLTLGVSTDGGKSYHNAPEAPANLVAALPYRYDPSGGPQGIMEPSNMIRGKDGYHYAFVRADDIYSSHSWICLMRTNDLADPKSWRAWDGKGFNFVFPNPYADPPPPRGQLCTAIGYDDIAQMDLSVSYNTYLGQYVMVSTSADSINNKETHGIYYAFSTDLIHWSHRQLLLEHELTWTWKKGDPNPVLYPSLLDPDSESRNFETTGQHAFLYLTFFNKRGGELDRDLIRYPVEFNKAEVADVPQYEFKRTGTVPPGATTAQVGYRFNTECDCAGAADVTIYAMRYGQGPAAENIVPNSSFTRGHVGWNGWGDASVNLGPSDLNHGQALKIDAAPHQIAAMNSTSFPVTEGSPYTVTFVAKVGPKTTRSGYFTLIFLDGTETGRQQIWPTPNQ